MKRKKRNKMISKILFVFVLNKNVFINVEFTLSFKRMLKLTFQNAFLNKNIFFRNYENKCERNKNKIK